MRHSSLLNVQLSHWFVSHFYVLLHSTERKSIFNWTFFDSCKKWTMHHATCFHDICFLITWCCALFQVTLLLRCHSFPCVIINCCYYYSLFHASLIWWLGHAPTVLKVACSIPRSCCFGTPSIIPPINQCATWYCMVLRWCWKLLWSVVKRWSLSAPWLISIISLWRFTTTRSSTYYSNPFQISLLTNSIPKVIIRPKNL